VNSVENRIFVFPDKSALSRAAADHIAAVATRSVARKGRFLWALSGGGTPRSTYRLLAGKEFHETVPWSNVHLFWADERCVPPGHVESNFGQARRLFLERVPLPTQNAHRIKGELVQEEAVHDYVSQLRQFAEDGDEWPSFDLTLLGLGGDGHTASLFPGAIGRSEALEPVVAARANHEGRPAARITLTPRIFNMSEEILFLVAGAGKASIISAMLNGPHDEEHWPVHRIRPESGALIWYLDEEAAAEL
jgi:6-phosphogluconolactonase